MIAVDTTFFSHKEAALGTLTLSTSIFTADILDAISDMGYSKDFILVVNFNHEAFFRVRFPSYELLVLHWWPVECLYRLTGLTATSLIKKFGVFCATIKRAASRKKILSIWFPFATSQTFVKTGLPTFLTIHDLFRFHNGKKRDKRLFYSFITDEKNTLISISGATKDDIIKSCACKKDIAVIPNSIDLDISRQERVTELSGREYILDINAYNQKKNTLTLLRAYSIIHNLCDCALVLCGGYKDDLYFDQINSYIKKENLSRDVFVFLSVSEEKRNWLLSHAKLFVTPSVYEGWGRTPVEAAVAQIPVISTKETSLFEATKGLVNYVENATDERELSGLITKVLKDYPTKEHLSFISKSLSDTYAPKNCARAYLKIFGLL